VTGSASPTGRGLFLVLEGAEGAGKSTQARLLEDWLRERGVPRQVAREPGGTPVGEAIRGVLLDAVDLEVPAETELLLMLAARAAFVRQVVEPALARGEVLVADRFELSSFAYQGGGRGLDLTEIRRLNDFATGGLRPDLTLVLDLPVSAGRERQRAAGKTRDRIEEEGSRFLDRVRNAYRALAEEDPRVLLVDAAPPPEVVQEVLRGLLEARFPEHFPPLRG